MKSAAKRALTPALAFLLTLLLFGAGFAAAGIYPFGKNSLVWCDMEQQAVPLLLQLRQILRRGEFSLYTALDAGGMNFFGVFFFFLSNPFSLLILLTDIPADLLVGVLVVLKLALAAAAAAFWFQYRVPDIEPVFAALLAVMYGACGYGLLYYQNLMWLDVMAMLPLLMASLQKLLREEKILPFALALCVTVGLCFYLAYMIVLLLLIYMALSLRYCVPKARRGAVARKFFGVCALCAALTAVIWLPAFLEVTRSARGTGILKSLLGSTQLSRHLGDKLAVLGCTSIVFAVIPDIVFPTRTDGAASRDRLLLLLFGLALLLDPINAMWHMGSYQAFPLRWGMILLLFLFTQAALLTRERARVLAPPKHRQLSLVLLFALVLLAAFSALGTYLFNRDDLRAYTHTLWISAEQFLALLLPAMLCAGAYFLALRLLRQKALRAKVCAGVMAGVFAVEFSLSFYTYIGTAANEDKLYETTMDAAERVEDEDFWRLGLTKKYAHVNMLGAMGYPTLAHYTSFTRADFLEGIKRMGYSSYWMEVPSTGGTALTDALWQVRYHLGAETDFPFNRERTWSNGILAITRSDYELPGAVYLPGQDPEDIAKLPDGPRAETQSFLARELFGRTDIVNEYAPTRKDSLTLDETSGGGADCRLSDPQLPGEIVWSFHVSGRQALYFDLYSQTGTELQNPRNGAVSVSVNGMKKTESFPENQSNGLIYLGTARNEDITVRVTVKKSFAAESLGVFGLNLDTLDRAAEDLNGEELSYHAGTYTVSCDCAEPSLMLMAVPYDEGFTAELDGTELEVFRVNTCMTAVRLPAGQGTLTLRWHLSGLKPALILAAGGVLLALAYAVMRKKLPERVYDILGRISLWGAHIAFWAVIAVVYVLPMVLAMIGKFL